MRNAPNARRLVPLLAVLALGCDAVAAWFGRQVIVEPPVERPRPHLELQGNELFWNGFRLGFGESMKSWIVLLGEPVVSHSADCSALYAQWPDYGLTARGALPATYFYKKVLANVCQVVEDDYCPESDFAAWRRRALDDVRVYEADVRFATLVEGDYAKRPRARWDEAPERHFRGTFFINGVALPQGPQHLDDLNALGAHATPPFQFDGLQSMDMLAPAPYRLYLKTSTPIAGPFSAGDTFRDNNPIRLLPHAYGRWFEELTMIAPAFTPNGDFEAERAP